MSKQKKIVKRAVRTAAAPVELPDWLKETPYVLYQLDAFCMNGEGDVQKIDVTKDEYEGLKNWLAESRGIQLPKV